MTDRIVWFDIPTVDLDRAIEFYAAVLNCEITREEATSGTIGVLLHEDGEIAGCLFKKEGYPPSDTGPLMYLNVNSGLKEALETATRLGGKIVQDILAISPYGYRAIIIDSEGNRIALHSYS